MLNIVYKTSVHAFPVQSEERDSKNLVSGLLMIMAPRDGIRVLDQMPAGKSVISAVRRDLRCG